MTPLETADALLRHALCAQNESDAAHCCALAVMSLRWDMPSQSALAEACFQVLHSKGLGPGASDPALSILRHAAAFAAGEPLKDHDRGMVIGHAQSWARKLEWINGMNIPWPAHSDMLDALAEQNILNMLEPFDPSSRRALHEQDKAALALACARATAAERKGLGQLDCAAARRLSGRAGELARNPLNRKAEISENLLAAAADLLALGAARERSMIAMGVCPAPEGSEPPDETARRAL